MIIVGIDYSMSSPAVALGNGDDLTFENMQFLFAGKVKKHEGFMAPNIQGILTKEWGNNIPRFEALAGYVTDFINFHTTHGPMRTMNPADIKVAIEGYAMGAKGQVFNIGENTGILKSKLWNNKYPATPYAPSAIKKFATGKGNANKDAMYEAFYEDTKYDLKKVFETEKAGNPVSDIVDAYYIAKYHQKHLTSD